MKFTIISLDSWGYNKLIARELEKQGHEVKHIDFRKLKYKYPNKFIKTINFFTKTLFNYNFKRVQLNNTILKLLKKYGKQDKILIIKGDNLSIKTLKHIKNNSTQEIISFFNDSFSRYPRMKKVYKVFDKVYSFEPRDCEKFGFNLITNYIYFPLEEDYNKTIEYDIFNVSSWDKRNHTMPLFANYFKQNGITSKLIAFSKDSVEIDDIEVINNTLSKNQTFELLKKTKVILDLQRPKQQGLSFRVMEALGMQKKLISTNMDLKNYDFYNPNNIALIENIENIDIPKDFFNTPYEPVPKKVVEKYHLSNFVKTVFGL